tara:strand:+ start:1454 stop:1696 length:243 start_codon:yes stop_codon:yes gene_type:complete
MEINATLADIVAPVALGLEANNIDSLLMLHAERGNVFEVRMALNKADLDVEFSNMSPEAQKFAMGSIHCVRCLVHSLEVS